MAKTKKLDTTATEQAIAAVDAAVTAANTYWSDEEQSAVWKNFVAPAKAAMAAEQADVALKDAYTAALYEQYEKIGVTPIQAKMVHQAPHLLNGACEVAMLEHGKEAKQQVVQYSFKVDDYLDAKFGFTSQENQIDLVVGGTRVTSPAVLTTEVDEQIKALTEKFFA